MGTDIHIATRSQPWSLRDDTTRRDELDGDAVSLGASLCRSDPNPEVVAYSTKYIGIL